jgi:hypothetical protein
MKRMLRSKGVAPDARAGCATRWQEPGFHIASGGQHVLLLARGRAIAQNSLEEWRERCQATGNAFESDGRWLA